MEAGFLANFAFFFFFFWARSGRFLLSAPRKWIPRGAGYTAVPLPQHSTMATTPGASAAHCAKGQALSVLSLAAFWLHTNMLSYHAWSTWAPSSGQRGFNTAPGLAQHSFLAHETPAVNQPVRGKKKISPRPLLRPREARASCLGGAMCHMTTLRSGPVCFSPAYV